MNFELKEVKLVISFTLSILDNAVFHSQAFSHPISANHPHPLERLSQEVQQLKDKLAEVSTSTDSPPSTKKAEPLRPANNLNHNTNNGTFLFPAQRLQGIAVPRAAPPPTSTNHKTSRSPLPSSAPPPRSTHKGNSSSSNKHTFLFGPSSVTDQHYCPAPSNTKLPKSNGSSIAS